jgi:hypothetical protein
MHRRMIAAADRNDKNYFSMCRGFIVPAACFAFVAFYAYAWPKFSNAESLHGVKTGGGH